MFIAAHHMFRGRSSTTGGPARRPGLALALSPVFAVLLVGTSVTRARDGARDGTTSTPAVPAPAAPARTEGPPDPQVCIQTAKRDVSRSPDAKDAKDRAKGAAAYAALRACLLDLLQGDLVPQALTVARAANDLFPAEPRAGIDLGMMMLQSGADPAAARAMLQEALTRPGRYTEASPADREEAYLGLGRLALAQADIPAARAALARAAEETPKDAEALYLLAAADQRANDPPAAATHIDKALQVGPDLAKRDDYLVASWAYSRMDRLADAQAILRRAITRIPNASGLHLGLGYVMAIDGKPVEALFEYWYEFENDAAQDPYAKEARVQFQDSLSRALAYPKFTDAIGLLRDAVEDKDESTEKVLERLKTLDETGFKHPTLDLLRAETLHASGDAAGAEALLRRILITDPAFLPPYFDLAFILRASERDEEARRLVAEAVRRNPAHWQLIGETAGAASTEK